MRDEFVFRCQCVATTTAGLRPPLLILTLVVRNEFAFRCPCVATATAG
jgi:hypothetical protein